MRILTLFFLLIWSIQVVGQDVYSVSKAESKTDQSAAVKDVRSQQESMVLKDVQLSLNNGPTIQTTATARDIPTNNVSLHDQARQLSIQYAPMGYKAVVIEADGRQYIELKALPQPHGMEPTKN